MRCLQNCPEIFCIEPKFRVCAFAAAIFQIFGAEDVAILREIFCKSRASGGVRVIESRMRVLLSSIAFSNSRKLVCSRVFACAAPICQFFGIEIVAIFCAKFADRARATFCIRKKSQTETALVIAWSCAAFKTALKFFATEFPRLWRQISQFSAPKTRQFLVENFENRARLALCMSFNREYAFCCHALRLKMRKAVLATDFLHARR